MGKYMKKSKIKSGVTAMEVVSQCSLGVRTRAKTLALQRQQENQKSFSPVNESSFSYLELRSRRLEKPPLLGDAKKSQALGYEGLWNSRRSEDLREEIESLCPKISWSDSRFRVRSMESVDSVALNLKECEEEEQIEAALEVSLGENNLDFEARERSTRESTPCSFKKESETLSAPNSTTRRTRSASATQLAKNDARRNIPTSHEMEEFFATAEQQQQRIFTEKYNFDITSESPLPGRYEWVQVKP